jgi:hypothetical protein
MSVLRYHLTSMNYSKQVAVYCTVGFGSDDVEASVCVMTVCEAIRQ